MPVSDEPLAGLSAIADRYSGLLCDVWGVIHNGAEKYDGAVDALKRFRAGGGAVVLVTNSPQRSPDIMHMLDAMGVEREAYDVLVSSGDATRALISKYTGRALHWVGPEGHKRILDGIDVSLASPEDAAAILISDPDSYGDTIELYKDRAVHWRELNLPLICANPDKIVESGDRLVMCGGAIAELYAGLGGKVAMAGKPHEPIYREALRRMAEAAGLEISLSKVLAVGDSALTDAAGAAGIGADFLFITGSIHAEELHGDSDAPPDRVNKLLAPSGAQVVGHMAQLAW